jgi:predicted nucleic acid-binding protein
MASSTLEKVRPGTRIFVDAPVFIYHFTGASAGCREFLKRCEAGEIHGVTSVVTLAEVSHRLMTIEAVMKQVVSPGNVVQKLRKRPDLVSQLSLYQEQVSRIPEMAIEIVALDLAVFTRSAHLRSHHGLLTNDSLVLATARELKISAIASADQDFGRLDGITLFHPEDL